MNQTMNRNNGSNRGKAIRTAWLLALVALAIYVIFMISGVVNQ